MASLSSITVNATPKLDPEFRKSMPVSDKSQSAGYVRSQTLTNATVKNDRILGLKEALSLIAEGTGVQSSYYIPILQECLDNRSVSNARMIHGHIVKTGIQEDVFVMTSLVNLYAKYGQLEDAEKLFDQMSNRSVVTWTVLMSGYVNRSQPQQAIKAFMEMLHLGAYPSNYTFGTILKACSSLSLFELGKQIHAYIVKYGVGDETSINNSLCTFYSSCGVLDSAMNVFNRIQDKNVISWTAFISACGDYGETVMGLKYFIKMLSENVEPNEFAFTSVLSLCCANQALEAGKQIHSMSIKLGYQWSLRVQNSIMYLYLRSGLISEAQKLFDDMENTNLVTWNAMIAGHAQTMGVSKDSVGAYHAGNEALNIFTKINQSGEKPDVFTFSSVFSVCGSLVALEQGEQVHAQAMKRGCLADVVVGTALVDMYNKCGSISRATKAFLEMPGRTLVSWTSMISAFAQNGQFKQALNLFEDMRLAGVRPNKITFVAVLSACSQGGMVEEAFRYFDMMKTEYKVKPITEHYTCLVDMYVRLGRLEDAFDLVKKMKVEKQSEFIWSILIAGCRSQGNSEMGFHAAEELLKLKPQDAATYVMLLHMYLSAGRYGDVSRIKKIMKEENIGHLHDWSWITIREKVYSFKTGECHVSSAYNAEVETFLESLIREAEGMDPREQNLVNFDNEVEIAVADTATNTTTISPLQHSERLAVAFGLLRSPKAAVIRVVKSNSICRDCHSFISLVSKMTKREIIIRDSKRLHRFVDGLCSCGNLNNIL